jgi:putative ABC transport system substrate-binding protein
MRRIGALLAIAEDDAERDLRVGAFEHGLQQLGWTIGDNLRIDYRWATSDVERSQYAAELISLKPDVLFASSGAVVGALLQATRIVPIVFVTVVAARPRQARNPASADGIDDATGFLMFEYGITAKMG